MGLVFSSCRWSWMQQKVCLFLWEVRQASGRFGPTGLGWDHCRAVGCSAGIPGGRAHTCRLVGSPLCLFFFSFPPSFLFLFWKVSCPHFWLEEGDSHVMSGQFRRREIFKQGRGLMLWNTFTFWKRSSTDLFFFHIKYPAFWFHAFAYFVVRAWTCSGTQRVKLITRSNPFLSGIFPRINLAHCIQQEHCLCVCVSVTTGTNNPIYRSL